MSKKVSNNYTFKKPDGSFTCIEAKSRKEAQAIFDKKHPSPKKAKEVSTSD